MKKKIKYDFLIIGAGFIGSIMALMLASRKLKVALIEKNKNLNVSDDRTTALSQGTTRILDEINCWQELITFCQPIDQIYVSNKLSNNYLKFNSRRLNEGYLGYIIENINFRKILNTKVRNSKFIDLYLNEKVVNINQDRICQVSTPKYDFLTNLLVIADGRNSSSKDLLGFKYYYKKYYQNAYIFDIFHDKPHHGIALERFFPEGPLAILPMLSEKGRNRSSVVWTIDEAYGDFSALSSSYLKKEFLQRYNNFFGNAYINSKPLKYPLNLVYCYDLYKKNAVLIGDASQGIHPIAGQGFNLGVRDCQLLFKNIEKSTFLGEDLASCAFLNNYEKDRYLDRLLFIESTDKLNTLFSLQNSFLGSMIYLGFNFLNRSELLKNFLMRAAMGLVFTTSSGRS